MQPPHAPHTTLTPKDHEWGHTTHGAYACAHCEELSEETYAAFSKIDHELHRIFYEEGAPHKYHVCCQNYVLHRLFRGRPAERDKALRAVAETMYTFNASPTHAVQWIFAHAERYTLMRHYDYTITMLTDRIEALEARLSVLDSDVAFLKEVDHVRHVDVLHASKRRMYEADKKI